MPAVIEHYLRAELAAGELAAGQDAGALLRWADAIARRADPEDVYRHKEGRKTLRFQRAGRSYFLKLHRGVGWAEILKNLLQARLPVLAATNEYRAISILQGIGVDTLSVAAYARRGHNPAAIESMIVTDDLVGTVSLEDYCANWASEAPPPSVRMRLLRKLADSARRMHAAGINHRDFYICHFHLDPDSVSQPSPRCYLIDLHRAQLRRQTPRRWLVKDLAGLYFSAMDCGLTRRDLLRFMRHYSATGLAGALGEDAGLWAQVEAGALRLYRKAHKRIPPPIAGTGVGHGL
jgi:lipopolysaccharide core heptose(I) kinase